MSETDPRESTSASYEDALSIEKAGSDAAEVGKLAWPEFSGATFGGDV